MTSYYKLTTNQLDILVGLDTPEATVEIIRLMNLTRLENNALELTNLEGSVIYDLVFLIVSSNQKRIYNILPSILIDQVEQFPNQASEVIATTPLSIKKSLEELDYVNLATVVNTTAGSYRPIIDVGDIILTTEQEEEIANAIIKQNAVGSTKFTEGDIEVIVNVIDGQSTTIRFDLAILKESTLTLKYTRFEEEITETDLQGRIRAEAQAIIDSNFSTLGKDVKYQYFTGIVAKVSGVGNIQVVINDGVTDFTDTDVILDSDELLVFTTINANEVV